MAASRPTHAVIHLLSVRVESKSLIDPPMKALHGQGIDTAHHRWRSQIVGVEFCVGRRNPITSSEINTVM